MLKILDTKQIKELDSYTIQHEPVSSIDLMERACLAFVKWFAVQFHSSAPVGIVCGMGNNGGDGLGIARLLIERGFRVQAWVVRGSGKESEDFNTNLGRLENKLEVSEFPLTPEPGIFSSCEILIDAIFGSGLKKPAEGIFAHAVEAINSASAVRVAVDIPSGLFADEHSNGAIVKAHHTVSFQFPKLAFLLPENQHYVSEWHLVNIGLDKTFVKNAKTSNYYVSRKSVIKILRPRAPFSHKGDYGKALLVAGSLGKMGACILGARAALRVGVGLLTVHVPRVGYSILQTSVPEAMVSIDKSEEVIASVPMMDSFDVIGIGPGIGQSEKTVGCLRSVLESGKRLVIDADGINILGSNRELIHLIAPGSILTPHPKEFERLAGPWPNDFERLEMQRNLARKLKCVIVLKGAYSSIAMEDGTVYFNSTGNPGMASGGSGDVLTGILTGLLAQGYTSKEAAILGVYLHGISGDLAALEKGVNSLIASDLVDYLSNAFKSLQ